MRTLVVPVSTLRRLVRGGIVVLSALHTLHAVTWVVWGDTSLRAFDLGGETAVPTAFAVLLLGLGAVLLLATGTVDTKNTRHWRFAGWLVAGLAAEEILQLHERVTGPVQRLLGTDGVLLLAWVIPALLLVAVVVVALAPFVVSLDRRTRSALLLAGAL